MLKALLKLYYKVKKWVKQKQEEHERECNMNYKLFFNRLPLCFIDTEWGKKARKFSDEKFRDELRKYYASKWRLK